MTSRSLVRLLCAVVLAGLAAPEPLHACDPLWLPLTRSPGLTWLVGAALADTLLDRARANRTLGGQRVRVQQAGGAGGKALGTVRARVDAVLVPWAYGPDCAPLPWIGALPWVTPGTEGFFTGRLRPERRWISGLPTLDVEMAWREPLWSAGEPRWPHPKGAGLLTPAEFMALYEALPAQADLERDPATAAARLRRWEQTHAPVASRPPARTMLDNLYRAAGVSLAGTWEATFELDDARELPAPTRARSVAGTIRLDESSATFTPDSAVIRQVHAGRFAVDFRPFGFALRAEEALGWLESPTEFKLILDLSVDHGNLDLVGTLAGGEVVGTWMLNSRPARAGGRFRLRRPAARVEH